MAQFVAMVLTVHWTTSVSATDLNRLVGIAVVLSALLLAFKPQAQISPRHEPAISALVGAVGGFIGGVSTLSGPVFVAYLLALRMKRDEFIGAISIIYLMTGMPMYLTMFWYQRFGLVEVLASCVALLPVVVGMSFGKRIRQHFNDEAFRTALLVFLLVVAGLLIFK